MKLKKAIIVPTILLICLFIVGCGKKDDNQEVVEYGKKDQAVYLVQMDINPSVIIGYDDDQIVVYLSSNNKDGYDLLTKYQSEELIGKTFEAATNNIISNAYEEGYDKQDFDVKVVSIGTKEADKKKTVEAIGNAVKNCNFEVKVSVEGTKNADDKVDFSYNPENTESVALINEIIDKLENAEDSDSNDETAEKGATTCGDCHGSGVIHCNEQTCLVCKGTGTQPCPRCMGEKWEENESSGVACLHCGGTGTQECKACAGSGKWSAWDEMCRGCDGQGVVTDNPEKKCPECGEKVTGDVGDHVLLTHRGGRMCPECGKTQDDLEQHTLRAHWDPGAYEFTYVKCPICNETTKFALEAHMKMHKDMETCEICGAYYHQNGFEEHYASAHNDLNLPQCSVCGNHVYGDFDQHMAQKHADMVKCKHCGEYVASDKVDFHNNATHSKIYAPECPICHVNVIGNTLEGHMNQCHSHMVQCPKCGEYVGTSLEDHYQKRHSEE